MLDIIFLELYYLFSRDVNIRCSLETQLSFLMLPFLLDLYKLKVVFLRDINFFLWSRHKWFFSLSWQKLVFLTSRLNFFHDLDTRIHRHDSRKMNCWVPGGHTELNSDPYRSVSSLLLPVLDEKCKLRNREMEEDVCSVYSWRVLIS